MTHEPQPQDAAGVQARSYYGRPVLKVTRWREPHLPAYLFLGGLSGASATLAAVAACTRRPRLARAARLAAAGGALGGTGFLVAELGRPERFLNMLRVAKPTSPMSMGAWLLAVHSGLVMAAAGSDVTGRLRRTGAAAGAAAALTGPVLATYPGVLLADTAVPAWHSAYRQLPFLFAGSAMAAAGASGLAATAWQRSGQDEGEPALRLALLGAAVEAAAGLHMEHRLGLAGEPYRDGDSGRLMRASHTLTLAGAGAGVVMGVASRSNQEAARRGSQGTATWWSRGTATLCAALLGGGALCTRFAVLRAGIASARDPKYVVEAQRRHPVPSADDGQGGAR
jgi:formate-dependent nitrite reductase membrane component NrfD